MRYKLAPLYWTPLFLVLNHSTLNAQGYSHCEKLITQGFREYHVTQTVDESLTSIFDRYCEESGSLRQSATSGSLDFVVKAVPVGLKGGHTDSESAMRNFCKEYSSQAHETHRNHTYSDTIADRAYESFDRCVALAQSGLIVDANIVTIDSINFRLQPSTITDLRISGVVPSKNVTCQGNIDGSIVTLDLSFQGSFSKPINFVCTRQGNASGNNTSYDEGSVQILTNYTNFSLVMPADARFHRDRATEIETQIQELEDQIHAVRESLAIPMARCTFPSDSDVSRPGLEWDNQPLDFPACTVDSHSAVAHKTGLWSFTAPLSGWYQLSTSLLVGHAFMSVRADTSAGDQVNLVNHHARKPGYAESVAGTALIHLDAGQSVSLRATARADDAITFSSRSGGNWVEITFVRP